MTQLRSRLAACALAVAAMVSVAAPAAAGEKARPPMALGVQMDGSRDIAVFDAFAASIGGNAPAIWTLWVDWGGEHNGLPSTTLLDDIVARDAVPMINWQPVDSSNLDSQAFRYKRIVAGKKDGYIRSFAQAAAAWGGPLFLRFAHEMNGNWFPWGMGRFDNTPTNFIAAWRRIHTLFQEEGATNVKFVWAPYRGCPACASFKKVWPGGQYVHFMSFSAFNWSTSALPWVSMATLYQKPLADLTALSATKRIIVSETASSPNGGDKAKWLKVGHQKIYNDYPKVVGIVYFNIRVEGHPNWRLTKPAAALDAYAWLAADPRFQGRF